VPVGGVLFTWRVTGGPEGQAEVSPDGVFVAGAPGEYEVTVEGASHVAAVRVIVESGRSGRAKVSALLEDDDRYAWNDRNHFASRRPENRRGEISEYPPAVNGNFSFNVPLLSQPGRGMDLALALTYNSRVWTAAPKGDGTWNVIYDIDKDWPAPGWSFSLPRMAVLGPEGAMLLEGDGTRHPFTGNTTYTPGQLDHRFEGNTTDGAFIRYTANGDTGFAYYPDGTVVTFRGVRNSAGIGILTADKIVDAHGNIISIRRDTSPAGGGRISAIVDTLGRSVFFYYDSRKLLTAITAAGPRDEHGNVEMRTLARFHYRKLRLSYSFAGLAPLVRNPEPYVIDAIYFPGTSSGYWFGDYESYSSYGMLRRVIQQRGMRFTPATSDPGESLSLEGAISPGEMTTQSDYDYPLVANSTLTEPPTYSQVSESWAGMDGDPRVTRYESKMNLTPRQVKITQPDGTYSVQYSENLSSLPDDDSQKLRDGVLLEQEFYAADGTRLRRSKHLDWELGYLDTPRAKRVENYIYLPGRPNDPLMTAVETDYGAKYNSPDVTREYGFNGTPIRTTRMTYRHFDDQYTFGIPYIINRVSSREVFAGSINGTRLSYAVSGYDERWEFVSGIGSAVQWEVRGPRGQLTSTTVYADAAGGTGGLTDKFVHDAYGNLIANIDAAGLRTTSAYNAGTQFAYPASVTIAPAAAGSTLKSTSSAVYDFNTGLLTAATDANGVQTRHLYDWATTRPAKLLSSTGAYAEISYDDFGLALTSSTYAPGGRLVGKSVSRTNGLGQTTVRETLTDSGQWSTVETKYDLMNRPWKTSLPYFPGQTPRLSTREFDALGRLTKSTAADGSATSIAYDDPPQPARPLPAGAGLVTGLTARTVDPWGRERWALLNSDGKLVEVVEPKAEGDGLVGADGHLTKYTYDAVSRLEKVVQGEQTRSFRYDGLGRMTHSQVAEKTDTLDHGGLYVGSPAGHWSGYVSYDPKGNVEYTVDARGVKTVYAYADPLNRLTSVEYRIPTDPSKRDNSSPILPAATTSYAYKLEGNPFRLAQALTAAIDTQELQAPGLTENYDYDGEGRLSQQTLIYSNQPQQPLVTNYDYDELGRLKSETYPEPYGTNAARKKVRPQYGFGGQVTGLLVNDTPYASLASYDAAGRPTSLTVGPSGMYQETESYKYDEFTGLLTNQTVKRGGLTLLDLTYDYLRPQTTTGRTGRITSVLDNLDHSKDRAYEYDALGRLRKVAGGASAWWQQYSYDRYGNRLSITKGGALASAPRTETPAGETLAELAALAEAPTLESLLGTDGRRDVTDAPGFGLLSGAPAAAPKLAAAAAPAPAPAEPAAAFVNFNGTYHSHTYTEPPGTAQVTMRNTGTFTWYESIYSPENNVRLCSVYVPGNFNDYRMEGGALPNGNHWPDTYVNYRVGARPPRAGTYYARYQLCRPGPSGAVYFGQITPLLTFEVPASMANDALIISQNVPTTMNLGQTYTVSVTVKNNGTAAWHPSRYFLESIVTGFDALLQDGARAPLPRTVNPGETITIDFPVTTPFEPKTYKARWQMKHTSTWDGSSAPFGDATAETSVQVVRPPDGALFTTQRAPSWMVAGQTYPVSVAMKNSGANAWQQSLGYALGSLDQPDNMTWGLNRVQLPQASVAASLDTVFNFNVTAPAQPGRYSFQWGMLREAGGAQRFGEPSPQWWVDVYAPGATPTPTPLATPTPTPVPRINVGLAFNGGTASASSSRAANGPDRVNDGIRIGINSQGGPGSASWVDATTGFPDSVQLNFDRPRKISEINVIAGQDFNFITSVLYPPTLAMIAGSYNSAFDVMYWDMTQGQWALVPDGQVVGNNRVWRRFVFPEVSTDKIMVAVNSANVGYSHLVEVEAYEVVQPTPTPTPTPSPTPQPEQQPHGAGPAAVPGVIQAEDFDRGGDGVAYQDADAANSGGAYRAEGVDIEPSADAGGGYDVGWTAADEWLEYTVRVPTSGLYKLEARVASPVGGGRLRFDFDGVNKTGEMLVPNTGGWQSWQTVNAFVTLQAGVQVMRANVTAAGFNFNHTRLTAVTPGSQTVNLAAGKLATQSSDYGAAYTASRAVDNSTDGNSAMGSVSSTAMAAQPWWQVDLGGVQSVDNVRVWNRTDCCSERLSDFHVFVSDEPFASHDLAATLAQPGVSHIYFPGQSSNVSTLTVNRAGRYVRVQLDGSNYLSMAEVQVWGGGAPVTAGLLADDFNDNALDPLKWTRIESDPLAVVEEANQRLQIAVNTGSATRDGYASLNTVDLTDARAVVEVPHASTWDYTETTLGVWASANDAAAMLVRQGVLYLRLMSPGAPCDMCLEGDGFNTDETSVPYSPTQHRFWRIRHDAASDALYWEASADGATWQMLRSAARPFSVNGLQVRLTAGNYFGIIPIGGTPPQADAAFFDNFKVEINNPNNPPTVSITAPAPGAVFTAPASSTIKVAAGDADGSVVKVEFFANGNKLGEDTAAPFEFNVSNAVAGTYVLTATAHDNRAAATTSAPVTVTVTRPSVNVAAVTHASEPSAAGAFSVTRSGDTSQPLTVSLGYGGTATPGADYTALPPTVTLPAGQGTQTLQVVPLNDSLAEGTETIVINVSPSPGYVAGGNSAATVELLDDENLPPAVTLTGPHNGASFTPPLAALDLTADASDLDGAVVKVEFFDGATKLGEDTSSPYGLAWANLATGTYSLTAKATDNRGATSTSAAAVVTVTAVTALADDFNDNATDLSKWTVSLPAGGTVAEQNQRLELTPPASAAGYSGYVSRPNLDLTGGRASVEAIQTTQLLGGIETYFTLTDPTTGNYLFFVTGGGGLLLQERTNGVIPPRTTLTYDAVQHRHWRIRHDEVADTVNWETSPDGVNWTTRRTSPRPFPLTNLQVHLFAGKYSAGVPASTAIFDNFRASRYQTLNDEFNNFVAGQALLVVGSTTLNASDAALKARLEALGFTVTVRDAAASAATDATGKSLVVISETSQSASVNTKFRDVGVPVLVMEMQVYDDMLMTGPTLGTDYSSAAGQTQITINAPTHPLAAGLTGTVSVTNSPVNFGWAKPAASAARVATWAGDSTRFTVFGYEKGMLMNGLAAPARRVGLFPMGAAPSVLNSNGWTLFDASVRWAGNITTNSVTATSTAVTITVNKPTVTVTATDANASEAGPDAGSFTIRRDGGLGVPLTVQIGAGGTATSGDYNPALGTSVTIPTGAESAVVQVTPIDDQSVEAGGETVTLTLVANNAYTVGSPSAATVTIADNDTHPPTVVLTKPVGGSSFTAPAAIELGATAADADGSVVKVEFRANGSKVGEDSSAPYELTWANVTPGEYLLTAVAFDNAAASTASAAVAVSVVMPAVTVTATDANASEPGANGGQFTVTRTGPTTAALVVNLSAGGTATAGSDYAALPATVTIPAGAATAAVPVTPADDLTVESEETVILTLSGGATYAVGSPSAATVTIADNDTHPPTVALTKPVGGASFTAPATITLAATAADADGSVVRVEFYANGLKVGEDSSAPYEFNWANVGPDVYRLAAVAFDNTDTAAESAQVEISVVQPTVTVTASDANASEAGSDLGAFTFTRDGELGAPLTVNYQIAGTAVGDSDYTRLDGQVTFKALDSSTTVLVRPINDSAVEPSETVTVTLGSGSVYQVGQPSSATVTIADNDAHTRVNVALAANGATAAASSTHPDGAFAAARAIDGTRAYDGGYWNDNSHGTFPDSLEVTFAGAKTIDEIDVYSLQDNYGAGEPDEALTFTQFGLTHFDLQYRDASSGAWFSVPGASASGNNKVWRKFIFAPVTTTGLKLTVYKAVDGWSRVVEVEAYEATNLALGKAAAQSSTLVFNPPGDAWRAVDGNTDGNYMAGSVTHTNGESQPWWQVDLGGAQAVGSVRLWNRTDCCSERLTDFHVFVSDNPFTSNMVAGTQAQPGVSDYHVSVAAGTVYTQQVHRAGRYVRVQLSGAGVLSLAELQVWRDGPVVTTGCSAQQDLPLDLFVRNFYQAALARQPSAAELQQVGGTLRAARAQGEPQLVAAAQALGRAIFLDGAEYEARDRSDRDFVWDVYWAYLSYGPDQAGWNFWTADVERWGREAKLPAFDTYPDFTNQVRRICPDLPDTNQAPVANAGDPYAGSISEPVQFDGGASTDPDGTLAARQWNFGDGLTATGATPQHTYARGDTYPVMLTVKDNRGALHSATTTAAIQGPQTTTNGATYVTQDVPATMNAGQTYDVAVTLRNTGTSRWTTSENFLLGAVNPVDGTAWKVVGSPDGRVRLPREVAPNETVNVVFKVVAPSAPGVHNFQRRMLQHGGDWFGDSTTNVAVNVVGPVEVPTDGEANLTYDNASNRITSPGYQYDEDGSMTRMAGQGAGGGRRMQYDAAGRLVKVLNDDGTSLIAVYTYGKGRKRLTSSENGVRTYYVAGMGGVISEYVEGAAPSANLVWSKNYIYFGGGGLLATQTAAGGGSEVLEFHHPDRLGSRLISSPTTGRHYEQVTLPFGTAFEAESGDGDRRRFAGYDRSAWTGLDYAVNRFYSAREGRFTQVDPIGMAASSIDTPQSLNLYSYVNNDPVNQTDPDGLTAFLWPSFFSFGIGFRFGGGAPMFGISSNYMIGGIPQPTNWHWFSPTRATPSAQPAQVINPNSSSGLADGGVMTPAGGAPPRWPPDTHDFVVFSSLPGLPKEYLHEAQRGSREVDMAGGWFPSTMNPAWAYAHSMVPGHWIIWWGKKKARREAIKAQQAFITKHINKARELMERANKGGHYFQKQAWIKEAHFHFGVAMHPVMDFFSPPHGPWIGFFYTGNIVQDIVDNLAHKHAESGPPSSAQMNKMVTVIRAYYLQILPDGVRKKWSKEAFTLGDEY
jgi:RHS repeat-associated protein